jgi:hypothetical protein
MSECGKDLDLKYTMSAMVNAAARQHNLTITEDRSQFDQSGIISFEVEGLDEIPKNYQNMDISIQLNINTAKFTNKLSISGTKKKNYEFQGRFIIGGAYLYNESGYFVNIGKNTGINEQTVMTNIKASTLGLNEVYSGESSKNPKVSVVGDFWFSAHGESPTYYSVKRSFSTGANLANWIKNKREANIGVCRGGRKVNEIVFIEKSMESFPKKPKPGLDSFLAFKKNPGIKYTQIKGVRVDKYSGTFGCTEAGKKQTQEKNIEFTSIQLNNNKLYTFNVPLDDYPKNSTFYRTGTYLNKIFHPKARPLWTYKDFDKYINCGSFRRFRIQTYEYAISRKPLRLKQEDPGGFFTCDSVDYVSCISEFRYENTIGQPANYEPYNPSLYKTWQDNNFSGKVNIYNQRLEMGSLEDLKINNNRVAQNGDVVTTYVLNSRHSMSHKWMKRDWLNASAQSMNGFNYLQRKSNKNYSKLLLEQKNKNTSISKIMDMANGMHGLNFTKTNYLDNETGYSNLSRQLIPDSAKINRVVEIDNLVFITNSANNYIFVSLKSTSHLTPLCVIDTGLSNNGNLNIGGCKNSNQNYLWFTYHNKCINEQALVVIKRPSSIFKASNESVNRKMFNATDELSHIEKKNYDQATIYNYYSQSTSLFGQEVYFANDWIYIGCKNLINIEVVHAFDRP